MTQVIKNLPEREPQIYYDEPQPKPPPLGSTGALAWIRENLFGSPIDAILTIIGAFIIVTVVTSFIGWSVQIANWFAIQYNFRLFMVGTFPSDLEWRVVLVALFVAFMIGVMIAAWAKRLPRFLLIAVAAILILALVIPILSNALIPLPKNQLLAGETEIVRGTTSQIPQQQVSFLGQSGEEVSVSFSDSFETDEELLELTGFMDIATTTLRNTATVRLEDQARLAELVNMLGAADDENVVVEAWESNPNVIQIAHGDPDEDDTRIELLTAAEYETLLAERDSLEVPEPSLDIYRVNQAAVEVNILDGTTLEPIGDPITIEPGSDSVATFTLPGDGWFVLEKTVAEPDSIAYLDIEGVFPTYYASTSFQRVPDGYTVSNEEFPEPQIEGERFAIPSTNVIDNRYRGDHSFADYLRVYLSPFLSIFNVHLVIITAVAALGWFITRRLDEQRPVEEGQTAFSTRLATYMLLIAPILLWLAVDGLKVGEIFLSVGLAALVGYLVFRYVRNDILGFAIGAIATLLVFSVLPGLIPGLGVELLPKTDSLDWGGFLLAVMLTVFGIIIAFPLGVGLALGRRSDLPAVSYFSTLFIEGIRGSPFITVLFFFQLMIPFLGEAFGGMPRVYRALIATIIFSAAYLAENVRGGLQSLPPGQQEAGQAVGLTGWQVTLFITLPQALRAVIPAIVGQFIGLFKDTSLVSLVGLTDPVRTIVVVTAQTAFKSNRNEAVVFVAIGYFVVSYIMSWVSRRIEATGSGAARRA